ncbi:NACHT, LRR and PYD domains-containing protein 4-like [Trichomycterus rosablanca]|uniref:NACHT, LRR and PYD domains-containing protein 4-like n=1 Tax=Trichomycterus rosablanca TaxID=2290929 RepID=UPI002F35FD59
MERPDSPSPSTVSLKSDNSMIVPIKFGVTDKSTVLERPDSPSPSTVSLKSDNSMIVPIKFVDRSRMELIYSNWLQMYSSKDVFRCELCHELLSDPVSNTCGHNYCKQCITTYWTQHKNGMCPKCGKRSKLEDCMAVTNKALAEVIEKIKQANVKIPTESKISDFGKELCHNHETVLDMFCMTDQIPICKNCAVQKHKGHKKRYTTVKPNTVSVLQGKLSTMTPSVFRDFKRHLCLEYSECFESLEDDSDRRSIAGRMMECFSGEDALKIAFHFLPPSSSLLTCIEKLKAKLKRTFTHLHEGNKQVGKPSLLEEIYTQLYITDGGTGEVNTEHEIRHIEAAAKNLNMQETPIDHSDIFKSKDHIKTVLTKGIAGIGKTVCVQKFVYDWADGKINQEIHLILPLSFRDLNPERKRVYSLMDLLLHYFPELAEVENLQSENIKLLLILDGLDECQIPLDFQNQHKWHDITKPTTLSVLLVNLIQGNLLPSAHLWITSRPAAIEQIPKGCVQRVTEVRGFQDKQKEEYFRKKFTDESLANKIIGHVKSSRSLHIMCHIPVFCWISATVLEAFQMAPDSSEIPKDQTQLYTHFLLIQTSIKNEKYQGLRTYDPKQFSELDKEMIMKLAHLAFKELQKGNLIFYEEDLQRYGIDVSKTSQFSTLCTQFFKEEAGFYSKKIFCFVHLSVQEFLAALYVLCVYVNEGTNVFMTEPTQKDRVKLSDVLKCAVSKAVQCKNGNLDLFLRFLLGLSLDSNQKLLQGLLAKNTSSPKSIEKTVEFIKETIKRSNQSERIINLFHCLNKLNDNSLVKDIQNILQSEKVPNKTLKPDQCSALAFVLLMSEGIIEEFDLRTYNTEQAGRQRLLPVVKTAKKAILSGCKISAEACTTVASSLRYANSPVRELDLSFNTFRDNGVNLLLAGLKSPHCWLEKLNLACCGITDTSCKTLASALRTEGSHLTHLDLSFNQLRDAGVEQLELGLQSSHCNLQWLSLRECALTKNSCKYLSRVLQSPNTKLIELNLRDNNLKDSGAKLLSHGLENENCKLQTLSLSGCQIMKAGCQFLSEALSSNSQLRSLDLSYNYPEEAEEFFSYTPSVKVNFDHGGTSRIKSGLRKYASQLTFDSNTANGNLKLSEGNRKVSVVAEKQAYPDHTERFIHVPQILCEEGLTGQRFYWEVDWTASGTFIGVTYKTKTVENQGWNAIFGLNNKSWGILCNDQEYIVCHNKSRTSIPSPSQSRMVGIYLDWQAGTLSFYSVRPDKLTLLHTTHNTFTEPLYPGFGLKVQQSTVTLCQMD